MRKPIHVQVISFWSSLWTNFYHLYFFLKSCVAVFFLIWLAWSFVDLFGPPLLRKWVVEPIRPPSSAPKTPEELARPEPDARMLALQSHCRHVYLTNGLHNFYCPICRKKLRSGRSPWWQV